jgi:uncharacterized protein
MPRFFCAFAFLVLGSCNRVPDEPASHATARADPVTSAAARCIAPLATDAPEVPKAAGDHCPPDTAAPFKLARSRINFVEAGVSVDVELARTYEQNERGLMYRKVMGEDEGMFFFLEERKVQTFWMHDTCLPLDMLFIDDDGVIVGVVESAPVLDDGVRSVSCPSRFVLEVNAGWARRHNVKPGQRVVLPT